MRHRRRHGGTHQRDTSCQRVGQRRRAALVRDVHKLYSGHDIEQFAGKVVFVNPTIEASGNCRIWAEVDNRQQHGHWLLQPGMEAQMTIELRAPSEPMAAD